MLRQKFADRNESSQLQGINSHRVQVSHSAERKGKGLFNDQMVNSDVEVGNQYDIRSANKPKQKEGYPKSFAKLPSNKNFGYATDDTYDLEFLEELDEKKELINDEIRRAERRIRDVVGIQIAPIRSVEHNYSGMKINQGAPKSTKKVIRTLQLPAEGVRNHPAEERYHRDMAIMKQFTNQSYHRSRTDKAEHSTSVDKNRWKERMSSQGKHRNMNASRELTTEQTEDGHDLSRVGRLPQIATSEKKRLEIMTTDDDLDISNLGKKVIDKSFDYWKEDRQYRLVSAKKKAAGLQGLPADGYRLQRIDMTPMSPVSRNILRKDSSMRSRVGQKPQKPKNNSTDLVDWGEIEGGPTAVKVDASFRSRKGRLGQFMKELALLSRNIEDLVIREHQVSMILHHEKTTQYLSTQYRFGDGPVGESEDADPRITSVQAAMLRRALAAASRVD